MEGPSRFRRLLTLICLLEQKGQPVEELVRLTGVSKRTLYRDLRLLKACQVPVVFDRQHHAYRLGAFYAGPCPRLSPEEIRTLFSAPERLPEPDRSVMKQALAKLYASLPEEIQRLVDEIGRRA